MARRASPHLQQKMTRQQNFHFDCQSWKSLLSAELLFFPADLELASSLCLSPFQNPLLDPARRTGYSGFSLWRAPLMQDWRVPEASLLEGMKLCRPPPVLTCHSCCFTKNLSCVCDARSTSAIQDFNKRFCDEDQTSAWSVGSLVSSTQKNIPTFADDWANASPGVLLTGTDFLLDALFWSSSAFPNCGS